MRRGNEAGERRQAVSATSTDRSRVVVAMSGGVDSSLAAALLVEKQFDVGIMDMSNQAAAR